MRRPSTFSSGCATAFLIVFGLPFLGGGLAFWLTMFLAWRNHSPMQGPWIVSIIVPTIFVFVGGGLIYVAILANRTVKQQAQLADRYPTSPWMWREDWAAGRADGNIHRRTIGWMIAAVLGCAMTVPAAFVGLPQLAQKNDPRILIVLLVCVAGGAVVWFAIRAAIAEHRFGRAMFVFGGMPFSPGGTLNGQIHVRLDVQHDLRITLRCLRVITTGAGDNRSTQQIPLWESSQRVSGSSFGVSALGQSVPVSFQLPSDAPETNDDNASDKIVWRLHAESDITGINYSDNFDVPVFRKDGAAVATAQASASSLSSFTEPSRSQSDACATNDFDPVTGMTMTSTMPAFSTTGPIAQGGLTSIESDVPDQPETLQAEVSDDGEGTQFHFSASHNASIGLIWLLVTAVFSIPFWPPIFHRAPVPLLVAFGLFGIVFFCVAVSTLLTSYSVRVAGGQLQCMRSFPGAGNWRAIPASQIASLYVSTAGQMGQNILYRIMLKTRDGKTATLASLIRNRQEARWIVYRLETMLGLGVDTSIHVALPMGTPVQRQAQPSWVQFWIGLNVFLCIAGFMLWRFQHNVDVARQQARAASSRQSGSARPAQPSNRPYINPTLQSQAEDLLAKCIRHEDGAQDEFNADKDQWTGHISDTPRLQTLEQQARYSTDLRVRYMEIEVMLAAHNLRVDAETADVMEDNLRSPNAGERSWAAYDLGAMASLGVESDHIHDLLVQTAKEDSDANVRQWAVEGLRFLKTDEALEDEFYFFTHDPSMSVRDRAGCNVADCGIFTRSQRMHILPKVIELAEDPNTTGQMRSWTFMTLQSITGEKLPDDAAAWRKWYTDHGAEKQAEFDALPWWQVVGDQ